MRILKLDVQDDRLMRELVELAEMERIVSRQLAAIMKRRELVMRRFWAKERALRVRMKGKAVRAA